MKDKSDRAPERCYRSGDRTFPYTPPRRLDGYRLYSRVHLPIPGSSVAGRRAIRRAARQLGWGPGAAQGRGRAPAPDRAVAGRLTGSAATGEGRALGPGPGPAAGLWPGRGLSRWQRRRRLANDPLHKLVLTASRYGPALGSQPTSRASRTPLAGAIWSGWGPAGADGHRRPSAPAPWPRPADHDRPRPDRRSDARPAGAQPLQRPLRHGLLLAARDHADLRRRADRVPGRPVLRPGIAPASRGAIGRLRWLLRALRQAFPAPPCASGWMAALRARGCWPLGSGRRRVRRGLARECAPGQARPTSARPGVGPVPRDRPGNAGVQRDALRGPELGPQAARDHEGRGRPHPGRAPAAIRASS